MPNSPNNAAWSTSSTIFDLVHRLPFPIILIDEAGAILFANERFREAYEPSVLNCNEIQELLRKDTPDWRHIELPAEGSDKNEVMVRAIRVHQNIMLVIDEVVDNEMRKQLDVLHNQIGELERRVATDTLTGVWSRSHFDQVISNELDRSVRLKQPLSLLVLDIDRFKNVNDTHGHLKGDVVLREFSRIIAKTVRSADMVFRWGGEEFLVLAPATGYRAGKKLAERLRKNVEKYAFPHVGSVTVSIGVAEHIPAEPAHLWFDRADQLVYEAKKQGRNNVQVDRKGASDIWVDESGSSVLRLVWQEAYECGEPTIDQQHKQLFELGNNLLEVWFSADASPGIINPVLDNLLLHINQHFEDEDAILQKHGYEEADGHSTVHMSLLARSEELREATRAGKATFYDFLEFLGHTVIGNHLFREDRKFFPLFESKQA